MSHSTSVVPKRRKRLLIDRSVQGALLVRVLWYSLAVLVTAMVLLMLWRLASTGPARSLDKQLQDLWFHYGPALVATLSMLPLVLYDVLRISQRFAGPAYRLRHEIQRLAQGEDVRPLRFREGDFWQPLAEDFNALLRRWQALQAQASGAHAAGELPAPQPRDDDAPRTGSGLASLAEAGCTVAVHDPADAEPQLVLSPR
jgi:hypothetical protein